MPRNRRVNSVKLELIKKSREAALSAVQIFNNPNIEKAVDDFNQDWYSVYGEGKGICDL